MKHIYPILAVVGVVGLLVVAGFVYTQMKTYTPAAIATEAITTPTVEPVAAAPVDVPPASPDTAVTDTPAPTSETATTAPTPEDENSAEAVTENTDAPVVDAPDADAPTAEWSACTQNTDCVPVGDCCDYKTAVNTHSVDLWKQKNPSTPEEDQRCALVECDKPQGHAECQAGSCKLIVDVAAVETPDPTEWAQCTTDADCAPVGTACCAANYNQAVNTTFVATWNAKHPKQACDPAMACIMMMPIAHCTNGTCTMNNPQ